MKAVIMIFSVLSALATGPKDPGKNDKNIPPVANAGDDSSISSKEYIQLDGTASREPDGIISRYHWSQVAGTPVVIVNPQAAITAIAGEAKGELVFRLTVTDDKGGVATDEVKLIVKD
jgi:hypothetical protein